MTVGITTTMAGSTHTPAELIASIIMFCLITGRILTSDGTGITSAARRRFIPVRTIRRRSITLARIAGNRRIVPTPLKPEFLFFDPEELKR